MYTYEITTGNLYDNSMKFLGAGYSGTPEHRNNPSSQHLVDQGPIVEGDYTIEIPPFNSNRHGKLCIRLIPDKPTMERIVKYGRNPWSFLCHGDSIKAPGTASEGCIIQSHDVRVGLVTNAAIDKHLRVVSKIQFPDPDGEISV